ncbi:GRAS family protein RAM1-like [Ziziphus jujuba]|uniref:GRAS family protein RAM1-like n=1 Tax=Ziziphus jujuba TaxID=326968 RepID=A0A6P3ZZJ4_ZIZJJ|nr:GRAS family protein RAM1-like [Ziziphus jujuba]
MEEIDEEKLLNLSLAIVTDSGGSVERKRKRIRREFGYSSSPNLFSYHEGFEGKIFRLLQQREQMLKLDHKRKGLVHEDGKGLHLIHLLLVTASAINENNVELALENLNELFQTVSLNGDSVQRVVAYFADGLAAKLLTKKSPFYEMIMKKPTSEEEFLAFMDLYRVSPYYQFAHFTANQVIIEAFEKEEEEKNNRALHIIDLDVSYGFQWPSLIQSLSEMASRGGGNNRISLRITGFGRSLEELRETENRLVSFSKGFLNLGFEFHGLLRSNNNLMMVDNIIRRKRNETVAVNLVFHLNTLDSISKISETLKTVQSLNPCIVVMVEKEGSRNPRSFLSRFMESLHSFAAMFDSLDDCLPLESSERLCIEKNHLGKEIKSMLNYEKDDDHEKIPNCLKYDQRIETSWKARMESHGFEGIRLSSKCMIQAKLLLKIRTHYCPLQFEEENIGGFKVVERDDGRAISLGWQDRYLLTASAWHCGR